MYLKKLEISGFKSFAARTTLDFGVSSEEDKKKPGITAVVGPNGSGKSNIADALRWVMGEQSMKNLRGKKTEDVIFAGSGKKARLGSAKVTLFLDNRDKKIPLDFDEVSISRRVSRSGESEYLINNSRVRLQDVIDYLAKAGLGRESYAIVNQGMADAILNASVAEHRMIIEEAAGVKPYQIKKERAIRKLDSTRGNLVRVKELTEEIEPHLKTLKRQAERASQGEAVSRELKEKQLDLFSFLWRNFNQEKNQLTGEKEEIGRRMMNVQREVDKLTDEINKKTDESRKGDKLSQLEETQRELRNKLSQLDRELIVSEGRIEIEKEKQKNIRVFEEIKADSIPVDLAYVKDRLEKVRLDLAVLIEKTNQIKELGELQEVRNLAKDIEEKLRELKTDIKEGKKTIASETNQNSSEKVQENKEAADAISNLEKKAVEIREKIRLIEAEIEKINNQIEEEVKLDKQKRQDFFDLEKELRNRQEELNKLKDQFNDSKISLARVEVREEDLKAEIKKELNFEMSELEKISGANNQEDINRDELEKEIYKLKIKLEHIGGIDPLVVEEYEETRKRFDFLTTEYEDLEKAVVSLREVIREMEQKIKKSFDVTFEEINKEFSKYFKIIFGGGNASLNKLKVKSSKFRIKEEIAEEAGEDGGEKELMDKEENLPEEEEIGIEISACPPGKRISGLAMLSGGERSLTSLALLFAIVSHNPPPFSILDEVEAALDEANSKRFGRIIQELSGSTQFIIITHNRETMRQASTLYGVTMGEDGISKLLSVKLDQVGKGGKIL